MRRPAIAPSARRHGVAGAGADMIHAFNNPIFVFDLDEDLTMITGPDTTGALIEVGFASAIGRTVILHAMRPARRKYLRG